MTDEELDELKTWLLLLPGVHAVQQTCLPPGVHAARQTSQRLYFVHNHRTFMYQDVAMYRGVSGKGWCVYDPSRRSFTSCGELSLHDAKHLVTRVIQMDNTSR